MKNGFLAGWDDNLYVYQNLDIQEVSFRNIKNVFTRTYVGNYAPVHMLSYMFDHVIWGLKPVGYILHNVLLNSLNGFLLYLVLKGFRCKSFAALCSVLVFTLHPVPSRECRMDLPEEKSSVHVFPAHVLAVVFSIQANR